MTTFNSLNLQDLKNKLHEMNKGDRIHALWGIREKYTDPTREDRMVDYALSVDKENKNKYTICGTFDFKSYELFYDALQISNVKKWYHFKGWKIMLNYEDMCKTLDAMTTLLNNEKYINSIWHFLSFNKTECDNKCQKQIQKFKINQLQKEINELKNTLNLMQNNQHAKQLLTILNTI